MLTAGQKVTFKTAIQANGTANQLLIDGNLDGLSTFCNQPASPAFWVWRPTVSRSEIYNDTSVDGTIWDWTVYKNQSVAEQGAWQQIFMGDHADFTKANLRAGIVAIFGGAPAAAQRTHILTIARRVATFAEKALATGTGSTASPATMGFEGFLTFNDFIGPPFQG
jgi:hypothetical protein